MSTRQEQSSGLPEAFHQLLRFDQPFSRSLILVRKHPRPELLHTMPALLSLALLPRLELAELRVGELVRGLGGGAFAFDRDTANLALFEERGRRGVRRVERAFALACSTFARIDDYQTGTNE